MKDKRRLATNGQLTSSGSYKEQYKMAASQAPAASQPIIYNSSCRAHHRLKVKSFKTSYHIKKNQEGFHHPPPPIVKRWGCDFACASEGYDFAPRKPQLKREKREILKLIVLYVTF